jgi:choline dehydrogenase-like flavoprotein
MVHPARLVTGVFEEANDGHIGPNGIPLYSQEFYETDPGRSYVRGYTLVVGRNLGPVGHHLVYRMPIPWGAAHHREMRRQFPHSMSIFVLGDDLPDSENRVELDPVARDSSGMSAARATYSVGSNSMEMLKDGAARARELLLAAGAQQIIDRGTTENWAHYMGTARMGTDPRRSVVDGDHRLHSVPNVYVVDGSSFVTGAGVNPTSTIGALALRAADRIWASRRK